MDKKDELNGWLNRRKIIFSLHDYWLHIGGIIKNKLKFKLTFFWILSKVKLFRNSYRNMVIKFGRKTALKCLICKQCQPNKFLVYRAMARCSSVDEFLFCRFLKMVVCGVPFNKWKAINKGREKNIVVLIRLSDGK